MQFVLFRLFSLLLELLVLIIYPVVFLILKIWSYQSSIQPKATNSKKGIMIHAASVGEVNAVKPLISALQKRYPGKKIVLTSTTLNGLKTAKKMNIPAHLAVLDLPWLRAKQLNNIDPELIIIVETEIWLNLLYQANLQKRKVVMVNARLSKRSLYRYKLIKPLLTRLQKPLANILAQSADDKTRLEQLFSVTVIDAGNLKYAQTLPEYELNASRKKYGYSEGDFIVCAGSSRPGEEIILKDHLAFLSEKIPNLKLIIAPRHTQRSDEIRAFFPGCRTLTDINSNPDLVPQVMIVDTIGQLSEFYAISDIALVGGSFTDFGGHNPLEPAFYSKPVIIGPYHTSCCDSVRALEKADGIIVTDRKLLVKEIIDLYEHPDKRGVMGKNAKLCLHNNAGSLQNHLDAIGQIFS
jgi:3-deoxy-D-manno-octulosonic-acid transferase